MGAIAKQWGVAEGAAASFEAGADILLICKDQDLIQESLTLIRNKLLRGEMPLHRLHESNERIRKAKERFLDPLARVAFSKVKEYFNLG
jgi:beta-N-acetylhexosaminidase